MLKQQKKLNMERFRKTTNKELIVENIITNLLRENGLYVEQYIPLILIKRYLEADGIKMNERQIRYNIDKLIAKRKIERRIQFDTKKGKVIKRGFYKLYWINYPSKNKKESLSRQF